MRCTGTTRIGCTKILEITESNRMVSGKIGEKLVCLPTQRYDAPSGLVGNFFVSILAVELDVIQDQK